MRNKVHRGRSYDACWTVETADTYRGVFNVESTGPTEMDGVINEKTIDTFRTLEAAEDAADVAAQRWIDGQSDKDWAGFPFISMSKRIQIRGAVLARNPDGEALKTSYTASYSEPVPDNIGMMSFGWTAIIDGAGEQPEPRTTIIHAPGGMVAPSAVKSRIEAAIVKHLEGQDSDHATLL
jgi:hypothetical protein